MLMAVWQKLFGVSSNKKNNDVSLPLRREIFYVLFSMSENVTLHDTSFLQWYKIIPYNGTTLSVR